MFEWSLRDGEKSRRRRRRRRRRSTNSVLSTRLCAAIVPVRERTPLRPHPRDVFAKNAHAKRQTDGRRARRRRGLCTVHRSAHRVRQNRRTTREQFFSFEIYFMIHEFYVRHPSGASSAFATGTSKTFNIYV